MESHFLSEVEDKCAKTEEEVANMKKTLRYYVKKEREMEEELEARELRIKFQRGAISWHQRTRRYDCSTGKCFTSVPPIPPRGVKNRR